MRKILEKGIPIVLFPGSTHHIPAYGIIFVCARVAKLVDALP